MQRGRTKMERESVLCILPKEKKKIQCIRKREKKKYRDKREKTKIPLQNIIILIVRTHG